MNENMKPENKAGRIVTLLDKAYSRLKRAGNLILPVSFILFLLLGLLLYIPVEASLYLPALGKSVLLILIGLLSALAAYYLFRRSSVESFQRFYESFFNSTGRKDELSAIDLHLDSTQQSSRFYNVAIAQNLSSVDPNQLQKDLNSYVNQSRLIKFFKGGISSLVVSILLLATVIYLNPEETQRSLHFWESYQRPNPFTFVVSPADTTVEHGTSAAISVRFDSQTIPDEIVLEFKTSVEENFRQRQMQERESDLFQSSPVELTSDITYRIAMDGFYSAPYSIDVQLQPGFEQLAVSVQPPAYTELPNREYSYPFPEIQFYEGSVIMLKGTTNKDVQELSLFRENGKSDLMDNYSERSFEYSFSPELSDTLTFSMTDPEGLSNSNPYRTPLILQSDQYPVVVIQQPSDTVMQVQPDSLEVLYRSTDDFGITRATLTWSHQRAFTEDAETGQQALENPSNGSLRSFSWQLEPFDLRPRDRLTFRILVWDNDEINGYKRGESGEVVLQVPSLTEYFDELDEQESDVQSGLDEISEEFNNMESDYQEFLKDLRENPETGFEESRELEEIKDRQKEIEEAVQGLNRKFEQLREDINRSGGISEETQRAYRELQELMKELDDPALREAMEKLQDALEGLSPEELEEALKDVEFNEQLYRERIQRTVDLFKQLKMKSDLDKLARQFEDLSERVKPAENRSLDKLSNELESVDEDLESVSQQLDSLDSNPPANAKKRLQELKQESKKELKSIDERLKNLQNRTNEKMESGGQSPDDQMKEQQNQISQQLQKQSQKFRSSISQMSGQQIQVNLLALQEALYRLLELSEMQEYLSQASNDTRSRSQGYIELARTQQNVNDQFSKVADTLYQVSARIPGVPDQINRKKADVDRRLEQSLERMVNRNQRYATVASRESLAGINDLTSMIANLIDQLMNQMNGGFGSGMSMQQMVEQLQNMSGDQQQLNQQLQQMINDMQGDRLSREQSERLDQMARQQNRIRKQIEELRRSGALEQGDRIMSELQRMMDDMEDSINDMRGGVTDPLMMDRQQNILSRMLSAEQAMQQRGEKDEREGTDASEFERTLPPDMTLEELQKEIRVRMQDPNFTRFSEKYQRLIEKYFERLRRLEEDTLQ